MALQHFYSRIPARISMFNKSDSYDTFACSDGIGREFIERELSAICDYKPSASETALIRRAALPPIYAQTLARNGEFMQCAIGFIPSDYTGERSSYVVHTLVFSEKEKAELLRSVDRGVFNADNFVTDMSGFDVTSPEAKAVSDYPELDYVKASPENPAWLASEYDANSMKRFIFAVLNAVCGKGKPVYPIIGEKIESLSAKALRFMNSFMQILPYHLRDAASFVTYTGDFSRFSTFRIKFRLDDSPEVLASKGVTVNFTTNAVIGLKEEETTKYAQVADFLYGLLSNEEVRREFLLFTAEAAKAVPAMAVPSLKTLSDLIFLFRCCNGMFDEKRVLCDDDKVYEYICVYEKYRDALSDESRISGMRCLKKYPETHSVIPKNVFAKICKIYPSESAGVRRVIMNVVSELIHTDVMRDKLFAFIRSNYEGEDAEVKISINNDLCRVFYGGFLQPQILSFFAQNYPDEPMITRDAVLDKILLAIRTKNVQAQILEFLRAYYNLFTGEQKRRIYSVIYEMLPEGDELAAELILLVDAHIFEEAEIFQNEFGAKLRAEVESEQRKKEHPLLTCLSRTDGFCAATVIRSIFTDWSGRKIFGEYARNVAFLPFDKRIDAIIAVLKAVPYMQKDVSDKFVAALGAESVADSSQYDLFDDIDSERRLYEGLSKIGGVNASVFAYDYAEAVISPRLASHANDFFKIKNPDGMRIMDDYVRRHPAITKDAAFDVYVEFGKLTECALSGDLKGVVESCEKLPCGKTLGRQVAAYADYILIKGDKINGSTDSVVLALVTATIGKLSSGEYSFDTAYARVKEAETEKETARGQKTGEAQKTIIERAALRATFAAALAVYDNGRAFREEKALASSPLGRAVSLFVSATGNKAKKHLDAEISQIREREKVFADILTKISNELLPVKKSLFSRIFGRK